MSKPRTTITTLLCLRFYRFYRWRQNMFMYDPKKHEIEMEFMEYNQNI